MADARERYIAKSNTPAIGSYGGGEDFGSPFGGGQGQPPGTTNEASVPYGGSTPTVAPPPSGGGGGDNLDNIVLNTTGSGATGGEDKSGSAYFTSQLDAFDFQPKFGIDNYYQYLMDKEEATGGGFINPYKQNLIANEPAEADFMPSNQQGFDLNPLPEILGGGDSGIGYKGDNFSFNLDVDPNINLGNMSASPTAKAMFKYSFDEGGPVGEPEIDQSGIASLYPEMSERPSKPFGATRENVGEQLEAFRNAPVHVDPPNIGFFGEKIPAPLFDKAMKYLESLPPSERAVIEEMIRGTIQQKQMQRMQEAEDMMKSSIPTMGA
tara:strand:- start:43 stop:1011 length:969 start_codon:yes stop_codon:yes gene_type:complete